MRIVVNKHLRVYLDLILGVQVVSICSYIEPTTAYNPFLVYCRELAPGTVSLTGDRAQGDDSKYDSHYTAYTSSSE